MELNIDSIVRKFFNFTSNLLTHFQAFLIFFWQRTEKSAWKFGITLYSTSYKQINEFKHTGTGKSLILIPLVNIPAEHCNLSADWSIASC